jgi:tetratricopeptide (TPR) repeat protein
VRLNPLKIQRLTWLSLLVLLATVALNLTGAEAGANGELTGLLADTNQPAYWRAVAATLLSRWATEPATQAALLAQLKNEHPLVREQAVRALEPALTDVKVSAALQPMLADPLRNVRVAAAWVLRATVDLQGRAGQDLQRMLDLEADQPTGQFEQATLLLARQQSQKALEHLKKAAAWDPISPPFLCKQAQVQDQLGQLVEALQTLDRAATAVPDDPHIPYVRAVILQRNGRNDEAQMAAKRALKIQPDFQPARQFLEQFSSREPSAGFTVPKPNSRNQ